MARAADAGPGVFVVVVWIGVTALAQVVRQPGVPSWDSMWQEDGGIFLSDALADPFLSTLGYPYNAYLHVVPRLIAGVAAALPLEHAALVLSASSALVVSLLSAYVYFASSWVLDSQWSRVTLAGLVVLLPATAYETTANVANLHWYLIFACFWALLVPSESWGWLAAGGTIALASVLSDPLAGLLLPLALVQALRSETWRGRVVPVVFSLGLLAQLVLGAFQAAPAPYAEANVSDLPGIYALRVAGSFLFGDRFLDELWPRLGWAFAGTSLVIVVLVAVYGFLKSDRSARFHLVTVLACSGLFLAVPLMLRGTQNFLSRDNFNLNGSRYTVLPVLFLAVAFLLVLDRPDARLGASTWRRARCTFVLITAALVVTNYASFAVRTRGPSWRSNLAAARRDCAAGAGGAGARDLRGLGPELVARAPRLGAEVAIRIAPNLQPPPWAVLATCERIR